MRGDESYNRKKVLFSINHSILSGTGSRNGLEVGTKLTYEKKGE